jgi:multiple sugar transport system ATP-binding protein
LSLLVTHDQIDVMAIADRIALLNRGQIEQEGSPIDLFAKDELTVRAYVTAPVKHELYYVEFPADALWIF